MDEHEFKGLTELIREDFIDADLSRPMSPMPSFRAEEMDRLAVDWRGQPEHYATFFVGAPPLSAEFWKTPFDQVIAVLREVVDAQSGKTRRPSEIIVTRSAPTEMKGLPVMGRGLLFEEKVVHLINPQAWEENFARDVKKLIPNGGMVQFFYKGTPVYFDEYRAGAAIARAINESGKLQEILDDISQGLRPFTRS